mmetsp:Transcript_7688/g.22803  ORF Transcript_7688/g.22803 Transcript_7688/m.22803 type:complete len:312 (+) Transcript_7688:172-1107(+)
MGKKTGRANGTAGVAAGPKSPQNGNGNARAGPETITLPSGEQVPVAPPPGIDPAMYEQALEYLRQHPEAALQAQEQMRRMGSPAMAQAASRQMQDPQYRKKMEELRQDPELKPMFDDIAATGSAGMDRYWNDADLMSRISHKMQQMGISPPQPPQPPQPSAPSKSLPNLHDAAKAGDEATVARLLDDGADVDGRDARGITPLGVAVGFNKLSVVKALLAGGADVALTDARGNTPLHYAAGYGRKDAAEVLLEAGAEATATNSDGQTPAQVAETNHEVFMVEYLDSWLKGSKDGKISPSEGKKPANDDDKYL